VTRGVYQGDQDGAAEVGESNPADGGIKDGIPPPLAPPLAGLGAGSNLATGDQC